MADISMCYNFKCASRHTCRRYMTDIGMRQAYMHLYPEEIENCGMYWHDDYPQARCTLSYG